MPPELQTPQFLAASGLALVLLLLLVRVWLRARRERLRFARIVSVDDEVARLKRECESLIAKRGEEQRELVKATQAANAERDKLAAATAAARAEHENQVASLKQGYAESKAVHDRLNAAIKELEEDLNLVDVGIYKPHFHFEDAEGYKAAILKCREDIKFAVKNGQAIVWGAAWTVQGSSSKGERMQKQYGDLMLRAFNAESDAAVANVSWNNITKLEARLEKALAAINKLGTVMQVELNTYYLGLRLKELRLVHEHAEKKQAEAEEQRRIREQMREEERVQRELERAKQEADADERRYQKALERARDEAAKAKGGELDELNERVKELERSLAEAHARGERAVSQAQLTKSGHVYVISNIGSFGTNVVKIGMTRRLEPMERVKELGDASVPFAFDVHAMIYSEDAPGLEAKLHRQFAEKRLNLVNDRKEFFRAELDEIAAFAESLGLKAELTLVAEAKEYRETIAMRSESAKPTTQAMADAFPATLS